MIQEDELRELLEEAAAYFEVPADGEARVLAAATAPAEPRKQRVPRPRMAIGVATVLVAVGGVFVLGTMVGSDHTTTASKGAGAGVNAGEGDQAATAGPGLLTPASGGATGGAAGASGAAPAPPITEAGPGPVRAPADSPKIVKTGSVQIEVRDGAVGPTMTKLTNMATGLGGYAAETKTAEGGDNPTGSVTFRIPVGSFESMLAGVRSAGTVKSLTTKGQDVTAQYADVQAKINALNAARDQYLTILHKATAIGDVLAVQDHIIQTQTEIDQLQGNLNVLADQASLAALSVDVAQHGSAAPGPPVPRSGLAKAWHDAVHGFAHGVEAIIGHSGTALLVLLILVALFFGIRAGWPWLRRRLV